MKDRITLTPRGLDYRGRLIPCAIGRGGVSANKREGGHADSEGSVA